jgi:hypothetical protein
MEKNFRVPEVNTWQCKILKREMQRMYIVDGKTQAAPQCQKQEYNSVTRHLAASVV